MGTEPIHRNDPFEPRRCQRSGRSAAWMRVVPAGSSDDVFLTKLPP
jgi:hypothetical protein